MKFNVFSRLDAQRFSYGFIDEPYIIISIVNSDEDVARFKSNPMIMDILRLQFDDVDGAAVNAMRSEDADKIIRFVDYWKEKVDRIVVHCEAGISRSAGICAALMLWLNSSDETIFDDMRYHPNMWCYRTVLKRVFDCAPAKGPFWIIGHVKNCNGKSFFEGERLISYPVSVETQPVPSHKSIWTNVSKNKNKKPWNYYPRGRVEIRFEKALIFLHPLCYQMPNLEHALIRAFNLYGMDIRWKTDNSLHYTCMDDKRSVRK